MDRNGSIPAEVAIAALIAEAVAAQRAGQPDLAVKHLHTILEHAPDNAQALNMLGLALLRQGRPENARALLLRATMADPGAAALWLNLAQAQRALRDDNGERESLENVLDRDPYSLVANARKADLHQRRGEEALAMVAWQAVLTLCEADEAPTNDLRDLAARARAYIEPLAMRLTAKMDEELDITRRSLTREDSRRVDAAIDHAQGKRRIFTSQCSGLQVPFLPADEYFSRSHFPWLSRVEQATAAIRSELEGVLAGGGEEFRPYVNLPTGAQKNPWTELSRSTRWSAYYLWRYGIRNDAACAQCPVTAAVMADLPLADLPGRTPTVFFSLLAPGTKIPPHTGVSNTRAIVHLPLVIPPRCGFRVGGETREWKQGEAWVFDDTIEHEAWNDSEQMRAILIFDVWNPYLTSGERELLRAFYRSADATGLNPDPAAAAF